MINYMIFRKNINKISIKLNKEYLIAKVKLNQTQNGNWCRIILDVGPKRVKGVLTSTIYPRDLQTHKALL